MKMYNSTIFILLVKMFAILFFVFEVQAIINPLGPNVVSDYSNCIGRIIEQDFKKPGLLFFANTNNVSTPVANIRTEVLKRIHGNIKYSVKVVSPKRRDEAAVCDENSYEDQENIVLRLSVDQFRLVHTAKYFVIIIDNYKDFCKVRSKLIRSRSWNPHGKFIILFFNFQNFNTVNVEYGEKMITNLYRHNVRKVIIIVPHIDNIRKAIIYGWRPYNPPNYCGYFNETAKNRLIIENVCDEGDFINKKSVFNATIPKDMKGCVLNIVALEKQPFISLNRDDPSIEMMLLNAVFERYNYKPYYEVLKLPRGEKDITGQWTGAMKYLIAKRGQVLLGGIFPDDEVHQDFDCSSSYLADSYTWVVPRAFSSPPWVALIIIFQKVVWLSVIACYIICVFTWKILGQLSGDSKYNKGLGHCFLNAWICSLGFSVYIRPITRSLRIFFVFFNLYCILFITAYQTKLFDVLTNPTFERQIKNVEQLVASGLKFGGPEELHDLFMNSTDPFDNFLGEQWTDVEDIRAAMIDVTVHRNFSFLCSRFELAHISATLPELSDNFGNYRYYAFEENVFTISMEMVSLRGFAPMKEFSRTIGMFRQIGVNTYVKNYFAVFNMRRKAKLLSSLNEEKPDIDALSVQHLQGGYCVLILGCVIASITLFVELMVDTNWYKNKIISLRRYFKRKLF